MSNNLFYLIEITEDHAQALRDFLGTIKVQLDPRRDMIAVGFDTGNIENSFLNGGDVPQTLTAINQYIQEYIQYQGSLPRVRTDHETWDLQGTSDFLHIAATEFKWDDHGNIDYAVWEGNQNAWQGIAQEYPYLFQTSDPQEEADDQVILIQSEDPGPIRPGLLLLHAGSNLEIIGSTRYSNGKRVGPQTIGISPEAREILEQHPHQGYWKLVSSRKTSIRLEPLYEAIDPSELS